MSEDLIQRNASDLSSMLTSGEISAVEVTQAHLDAIASRDEIVHAFLHVDAEGALATAKDVDTMRAAGEKLHPLAGVPIAVKDVMCTQGMPTTCGSKMLEGWIPPYDATVVENIRRANMPILGKTNMDEFAMGSSTEFSAYGPSLNPWDTTRIPGGSGGGSSAALAAFETPLATGTDTGGSIRQPAAVTGTVGVKPTYGGMSRYGIVAMASSLDQAGPCARNVLDAALLHDVMASHDPKDSTSLTDPPPKVVEAARQGATQDLAGVRIGVVDQLNGEGFQGGVRARFDEALALLQERGAQIVHVSCPSFEYALAAYYLIMPAEASSNLARFDAMRYGLRVEPSSGAITAETVMAASREAGFGPEVKRRIILGTYALSAGYYDAYYGSAQKVRTLVQQDLDRAFADADVLISPTSPTTAFRFGEKLDDPMAMYINDITTIPANLAGIPGMSLPAGLADEDSLPVGMQILAPAREDARLYRVGAALEAALLDKWGAPLLSQVPVLGKGK